MRIRSGSIGRLLSLAIAAIGVALAAGSAAAQPEIGPNIDANWTVQPAFGQVTAGRDNVSGVTCLTVPPGRDCLVVNDGAKFAQLFSITGTAIHPGSIVGFADSTPQAALISTPNAEGAANDGRFFYVVTSRGRIEASGQADTSFVILRFTLDAAGRPVLTPGTGIEGTDRIRTALQAGIPIPQIPGQQLDLSNTQIEGIAVKDGVVHLGLRAPVLSGKAFILSTSVQSLFRATGPLNPTVNPVALGPDTAIHDLAAVTDGILILAGPGRLLPGRPTIFLWKETTGVLQTVAKLTEPIDRSAEALLLLDQNEEFFRIVVMFDGVTNGGPIEYFLPR
jgi:Protein of unknown function (DUF3616)